MAANLGGVLEAALAIGNIFGGPNLALFMMGIFVPWVNSYGAISGYLGIL